MLEMFQQIKNSFRISNVYGVIVKMLLISFLHILFFLFPTFLSSQQEIIYNQQVYSSYLSTRNENAQVGNDIVLAENNRYLSQFSFVLITNSDVVETNTEIIFYFYSSCPVQSPLFEGECDPDKLINTMNYQFVPKKDTTIHYTLNLPSPIQLNKGDLNSSVVNVSYSSSQPIGIAVSHSDPTIGSREHGENVTYCGIGETNSTCSGVLSNFEHYNFTIIMAAVPDPWKEKNFDLILSADGTGTITLSDNYIGDENFFPTVSKSFSKSNFTCDDVGWNDVTLDLTFADGRIIQFENKINVISQFDRLYIEGIEGNNYFCEGEPLYFNLFLYGGVEPHTFTWSGPGGTWINENTASPIIFNPSPGIYSVSVTNGYYCQPLAIETFAVWSRENPVPDATIYNNTLCHDGILELDILGIPENKTLSYAWDGPGDTWVGADTRTPTVLGAISGDYFVTLTDHYGCQNRITKHIIKEDITPPIANCKNRLIEIVGVNVTLTGEDVNNQSSDDCSIQTLLLDGANYVVLDDSDLGLNYLTLTVIDFSGNSSTCESVINVVPDLCPGSDGIDSDNGGLPDDCDCSPNDDFNDKIFLNRDVNTGMDFDGIDDYLSTPNAPLFNPSATSSISFEAWIKPDLTQESNTIISKGDGGNGQTAYILETQNSKLRLFLGNSAGSGTWFTADTQLEPNVWTHVAASYNHTNSTVTFYVNGSFSNTESVSFTIYSADTELFFIGRQGYLCGCNYFKGQMDEVRVWSSDYNSLIRSYKDKELRGGEQSLLAYYSFNDGVPGGNNNNRTITKDYSPNGHHASLSNMAKNGSASNWVNDDLALAVVNTETLDLCLTCPNVQNGGMHFDGSNTFLEVDRDPVFGPSLTSSFTFEAWVNPTTTTSDRTILSRGSGEGGTSSYIFSVILNKVGLYIGDGSFGTWIYSDTNVSGNTWTHVAVVYDHVTNTFTFYKNGIADGIRTITHGFYAGISSVFIGQRGSAGYNKFLGKMDEVRIWKKARTAAEISHYMNKKLYGGEEALSAYYNFDDGIPWGDNTGRSYAADASLNGHEATLHGFAKTGVTSNWVDGPNNNNLPTNSAMSFDFLEDYISIANHQSLIPTATNAVTFEAWIFFTPSTYANIISASGISPNNNHQISIENNKLRVAGTGVSPLLSEQTLDPNAGWTHIAVVFDKTNTKIYINGLLDNTRVQTLAATNLGHSITLGSTVIGDSYNGNMDDVRYWDHARSQDEIQEAMYQELTGKETGLAAYYNFNNGVASGDNSALTIVPDVSDNGHDGTVSGFARTGGISNWTASPFNFGDLDNDGIPDFCDKCVFEKDIVIYDYLWKSVYRASETITLRNDMTLPANWNLKFETPQLLMDDHIQVAVGTEIMVTPFVCADGND